MEEAQSKEPIINTYGWGRISDESSAGKDFVEMIKFINGLESVTLSMCMRCAAMVLPIGEIKKAHLVWHTLMEAKIDSL